MDRRNRKPHVGMGGVSLENVQIKMQPENKVFRYLIELLILCSGVFGTLFSFLQSFKFGIDLGTYAFITLIVCVFWYIVFNSKAYQFILSGFLLILIIGGAAANQLVLASYQSVLNSIRGKADIGGSVGPDLALLLFVVLFSVAISYVVIHRNSMYLVAGITVTICVMPMAWGKFPPILPLGCVGIYLASMAAISKRDGEDRKKVDLIAGATGGLVLLIYLFLMIILPQTRYTRVALFENIRAQVQADYDKADLPDTIEQIFDDVAAGGVNGGELGKIGSISYEDKTMLKVTTGTISDVLYLRGYVGAEYANNRWNDLSDKNLSKYERVFTAADDAFIDIYSQTSELMSIIENDEQLINKVADTTFADTKVINNIEIFKKTVFKRKFRIEYYGATQKYSYLPYGSVASIKSKSTPDGYPINLQKNYIDSYAFETENVKYQVYKDLVDSYTGNNVNFKSYVSWEAKYRNMVYKVYTNIPDSYLKDMRIKVTEYTDDMDTEEEKEAFVQVVKEYLAANYSYTLEPGVVPAGKDFIEYFLYESKQGYCTYFASAAVMIFRAAGIPARYVEGYVANTSDTPNVSRTTVTEQRGSQLIHVLDKFTQYTIDVKDRSAHAWVEIYKDGYGWVPVEVTPGMNGMSYLNRDSSSLMTDIVPQYIPNDADSQISDYDETSDSTVIHESPYTVNFREIGKTIAEVCVSILKITVLVVLLMILYYMIHLVIRKKMNRVFDKEREDLQAQVIELYMYVEKICKFLKLRKEDSMSYGNYVEYLNRKNDGFTICNINAVMDLVLRVKFGSSQSAGAIRKEEVRTAIESIEMLRKNIYKNSGKAGKLIFRFYHHLY